MRGLAGCFRRSRGGDTRRTEALKRAHASATRFNCIVFPGVGRPAFPTVIRPKKRTASEPQQPSELLEMLQRLSRSFWTFGILTTLLSHHLYLRDALIHCFSLSLPANGIPAASTLNGPEFPCAVLAVARQCCFLRSPRCALSLLSVWVWVAWCT